MKIFINDNFLLTNKYAQALYHNYAENEGIIDYHNHLPAKDIYERRRYENLTQLWLEGDHYKWRAMRAYGIEERFVTGSASDYEKFEKWAYVVPKLAGSPLYHWTHLELKRYFGIDTLLCPDTAKQIYTQAEEMLKGDGFDAASLLEKMKVKALCTTDGPADSLEWHIKIAQSNDFSFKVLPTFRPDGIYSDDENIKNESRKNLGQKFGIEIKDFESLKAALSAALDFFTQNGCVIADHGFSEFEYNPQSEKGKLMKFLGEQYAKRGMVMQIHIGAVRNASTRLLKQCGPDAGGDSVGNTTDVKQLAGYLDALDEQNSLPKTILYCLNAGDNHMMAALAASFSQEGVAGKVQFGSAWWFLDNIRGMEDQMDELMETNMLAASVGMLTDSRSFTSFTRHEYYRRILCNKLGTLVEQGLYPEDMEFLGEMVRDICVRNAEKYFGL